MATLQRRAPAAALLSLLALAGCADSGSAAGECTVVGAVDGVSLTVDPGLAGSMSGASLSVCWDGSCTDSELELRPAASAVDEGCTGDSCSARSSADGTLTGFAEVPGLPDGTVTVQVTPTGAAGEAGIPASIDLATQTVHPNGTQCPEEAKQLSLRLDSGGLVPQES